MDADTQNNCSNSIQPEERIVLIHEHPKNQRCVCAFSVQEYARGEDLTLRNLLSAFILAFLADYSVVSCRRNATRCWIQQQRIDGTFMKYVWDTQLLLDETLELYAFHQAPLLFSGKMQLEALQQSNFAVHLQLFTEHDELIIQFAEESQAISEMVALLRSVCSAHGRTMVLIDRPGG